MTLRHLKIFVAVCESMNMTQAAEKLYISQSAVSQGISELEKYYNIRLFERLSRKLYLTEAGKKLLSYAHHLLRLNATVESDMREMGTNGTIRIGASVTIGAYLLPKLVLELKKLNPTIEIEVFEDNTERIEKMLLEDRIDIGIVEGETSSEDLVKRSFVEDELVLICGPKHRFSEMKEVLPEDLEKEAFIIREKGSGTRKTFEDMMRKNGLRWKTEWTCNNFDTIKMAVGEGLGVSVISRLAVEKEIGYGLLCEKKVQGILFERQFKIIYHKNKYLTEQIHLFCRLWEKMT